jgi:type IV secretion system protein VirB6
MSACPAFGAAGPASIADALQKVDCLSAEATNASFGRLFAPGGALTTALTILLTLYVALFAFNLLTGRSSLRMSALTPRMMTIGLIITFVTSWVAYQSVVWNLAVGAPDQIAGTLLGTRGSATLVFAQKLDTLFTAVTNAADSIAGTAAANEKLASPANMLWVSSLILLLGTVGVLVVCRIALAALLILGPVFIVLALFEGTRGLFEGWLKSVAMFALVPLLTVVMGSGALMAIFPMVDGLGTGGKEVSLRTAVGILVTSIVYLALMLLTLEVAASLTRGWRLPKSGAASKDNPAGQTVHNTTAELERAREINPPSTTATSDRVRTTVASLNSSVSTDRVVARSAAGGFATAAAGGAAHQVPAILPNRHSLYFSHRSQPGSPPLPREMFR